MTPLDIVELVGVFVVELTKLIQQGVPKDAALKRIRRITDDAATIDQDVDQAVARRTRP